VYLERNSEEIDIDNSLLLEQDGGHPLNFEDEEENLEEEKKEEELKDEREPDRTLWEEIDLNWRPIWNNDYQMRPGPSQIPPDMQTYLQYFSLFINDEVLEMIVNETNRYAEQFFIKNPEKRERNSIKIGGPAQRPKYKPT